jgi:hypothetical protein
MTIPGHFLFSLEPKSDIAHFNRALFEGVKAVGGIISRLPV